MWRILAGRLLRRCPRFASQACGRRRHPAPLAPVGCRCDVEDVGAEARRRVERGGDERHARLSRGVERSDAVVGNIVRRDENVRALLLDQPASYAETAGAGAVEIAAEHQFDTLACNRDPAHSVRRPGSVRLRAAPDERHVCPCFSPFGDAEARERPVAVAVDPDSDRVMAAGAAAGHDRHQQRERARDVEVPAHGLSCHRPPPRPIRRRRRSPSGSCRCRWSRHAVRRRSMRLTVRSIVSATRRAVTHCHPSGSRPT